MRQLSLQQAARWIGVLVVGIALSGCNTMRGFGKDVERGGERVQDAATSTQNRM
ncbi:MAG: entericidin A/B family lipoprotein [Burkholderiaceae bacterium]|jgi:predicted small secreted protein|nr:entericidin A/B family lipoprotein [Burkholderiaceae bacterium]